jgi:hypothetical protein
MKDAEPMIIPVITAAMTISPMIILLVNGNKKTMVAEIALSAAMTTIINIGTNERSVIEANTCIKVFIHYYCLLTMVYSSVRRGLNSYTGSAYINNKQFRPDFSLGIVTPNVQPFFLSF